jgi:hypothetical protein
MRAEGWLMLIVSWAGIGTLTVYTIIRTLRAKPPETLSAPLDIEKRIEEEDRLAGE